MFRVGDKVTQLRNNYDKGAAGVFNGTTGVVTGMSIEDHALTVRIDEDDIHDPEPPGNSPTHRHHQGRSPSACKRK